MALRVHAINLKKTLIANAFFVISYFVVIVGIRFVSFIVCNSRPATGGGKIPGARSVQRGPEISVKCFYHLSTLYVCPK
jgi:hypothetical protein